MSYNGHDLTYPAVPSAPDLATMPDLYVIRDRVDELTPEWRDAVLAMLDLEAHLRRALRSHLGRTELPSGDELVELVRSGDA